MLVGCGFEGVVGRGGVGEGLEEGSGWERVVPCGVLHEGVGGAGARGVVLGEDEGADEDAFDLAYGVGTIGGDARDTLRCGLFEFLTEHGRVDTEFLCGVAGEQVSLDLGVQAIDMGQEEVHCLDLGFGGASWEEFASAVDQVVGVAHCATQGGGVCLDAMLTNEAVGVEASFENDDLHVEIRREH